MVSDLLQSARSAARAQRYVPYARQRLTPEDEAAVLAVLRSEKVTQGPQTEAFEAALAAQTGARYAVAVCNGTAALHLACRALGVETGTPAAVPAITFAATANAVRYGGGEVGFAEVEPLTGHSTPEHLEAALHLARQRGNAGRRPLFLPVSLNGRVPDLAGIAELAEAENADVIEDAAHSLGGTYVGGRRTLASGSCAHTMAAILSFHPAKHICAGEGGAVLTNDAALAERVRCLRSHGIVRPKSNGTATPLWFYEQVDLGHNYRLTEMQAALGLSQLQRLPQLLRERERLARRYDAALNDASLGEVFARPALSEGHAWHLYALHFRGESLRDAAVSWLHDNGIGTQVHYRPLHRMRYYAERYGAQTLPEAEAYGAACLSLPLFPGLTDDEQDWVIDRLKLFCEDALAQPAHAR
ncbi:MAG: aminotransferase class I/II-fold pyridoxal phosphate-dependent enzyme [Opitutales bacterium]